MHERTTYMCDVRDSILSYSRVDSCTCELLLVCASAAMVCLIFFSQTEAGHFRERERIEWSTETL